MSDTASKPSMPKERAVGDLRISPDTGVVYESVRITGSLVTLRPVDTSKDFVQRSYATWITWERA